MIFSLSFHCCLRSPHHSHGQPSVRWAEWRIDYMVCLGHQWLATSLGPPVSRRSSCKAHYSNESYKLEKYGSVLYFPGRCFSYITNDVGKAALQIIREVGDCFLLILLPEPHLKQSALFPDSSYFSLLFTSAREKKRQRGLSTVALFPLSYSAVSASLDCSDHIATIALMKG